MGLGKLGGIFSLKAIVLACFLTPVSAPLVAPITPAYGQFQIIIPGFGYRSYYRGSRYRYRRRSARRGDGNTGAKTGASANSPGGAPVTSAKGYRSTSDK
jgi:hypothetical protein